MTTRDIPRTHHLGPVQWQGVAFLVLGLMMGGLLILIGQDIYALQGGMSLLAMVLPFGYAFGAGMVATVNPCGVLLLPSLVAYYLSRGESAQLSGAQRAGKALLLGLMATLGFVTLFAVVGLIIGTGGQALAAAFPVGGFVVGIVLALLGAWLALSGEGLGILAASRAMERVELGKDVRSLYLFGVAYAITSLACTLPVFLVVAGSAMASGNALAAAGQFVSYALGMGTVLTVVILMATFFQRAVTLAIRGVAPYVHRLAASFLLGAGIFIVKYWLATGGLLGY